MRLLHWRGCYTEQDPVLPLAAAEVRGGLLAAAGFAQRRDAWLREREPRTHSNMKGYLWVHAYAEHAETSDQAQEAMAALGRFGGMPSHRPLTATNYSIGRTLLLAGKTEEAVGYLRKAAHACMPLSAPVRYVRANLFLGQALEATGDKAGACKAYDVVLARWGKAKPRSVTAEEARRRSKALGCTAP